MGARLFTCLVNWTNSYVSATIWISILLGGGIQYLLLKKSKKKAARHSFAVIVALAVLVCEFICQAATGWDLFGWLIIYGIVLSLLIGAGAAYLIRFLLSRRKADFITE